MSLALQVSGLVRQGHAPWQHRAVWTEFIRELLANEPKEALKRGVGCWSKTQGLVLKKPADSLLPDSTVSCLLAQRNFDFDISFGVRRTKTLFAMC